MLQSLRSRRNRKGFTLAELLIVVAIIAVLVAIAVPLFVGSLNKAREARDNANKRAVRGVAVVYLLENEDDTKAWTDTATTTGWNVEATIDGTGTITGLKVEAGSADTTTYTEAGKVTAQDGGKFLVQLHIAPTEITSTSKPVGSP